MNPISKRAIWSQAIQSELSAFANDLFQIIRKRPDGTERCLGNYKEEAVQIGKTTASPGRILPLERKGSIRKENFIGGRDFSHRFRHKSVQENQREHEWK